MKAYGAFATLLLTTPFFSEHLDSLDILAETVDISLLSQSIVAVRRSTRASKDDLWLLTNLIYLHRLNKGQALRSTYIKTLCILLSATASEIIERGIVENGQAQGNALDESSANDKIQPLPPFIRKELDTLANKESVTGLLGAFNL